LEGEDRPRIRDILERYSYSTDVVGRLRKVLNDLDTYKVRVEVYLRRGDVPIVRRANLVDMIIKYHERVKEVTGDVFMQSRRPSRSELIAKANELIKLLNEFMERLGGVVGRGI